MVWPSAFPFVYSNLFSSLSVSVLKFSQDWRHVGDYGKNVTSFFFPFMSCFVVLRSASASLPSVWESVYGLHESVYASACWILIAPFDCGGLLPQRPPTPAVVFLPLPFPKTPISVLACLLLQHLVHNHPTSHFFFFPLWEEHRTRVRRLPSSHLRGLSHSQRETRPGVQTHCQTHAQCLVSLLDLHTSLSSSLIHRHTAGLLESLRWGSRGTPLSLYRRFYWFLDLIPAARLFRDENTSTWTLLDASQAPQTPLPLSPFTPGLKFLGAKPDFSHRAVLNSRNAPLTGNFSRWYFLTLIPDSSPFSRK